MTNPTFFLKDIRVNEYRSSLSAEHLETLDQYLADMKRGPADGEMDIEWQEMGRGYYAHLHRLDSLDGTQERVDYLKRLKEDINLWLVDESNNYMVKNVRDILSERR